MKQRVCINIHTLFNSMSNLEQKRDLKLRSSQVDTYLEKVVEPLFEFIVRHQLLPIVKKSKTSGCISLKVKPICFQNEEVDFEDLRERIYELVQGVDVIYFKKTFRYIKSLWKYLDAFERSQYEDQENLGDVYSFINEEEYYTIFEVTRPTKSGISRIVFSLNLWERNLEDQISVRRSH